MSAAREGWLLLVSTLMALVAVAQPVDQPLVKDRVHQERQVERQRAAEWGLRHEEWQRYRQLMQGPLGVYSPNLDPLTALGLEARDPAEQERYAQIQVKAEFARLQKLFDYQNAYDRAYKQLYADQLPINLIGTDRPPQASPVESTGRLAVFVTAQCKACLTRVRQLQREAERFDLYLLDTDGNDNRLRDWARQAGIDPHKVRQRQITLNHDAGQWARLGDKGTLPAVMRPVSGQWTRQ